MNKTAAAGRTDAATWGLIATMACVCVLLCHGLGFSFGVLTSVVPVIGVACLCAAMLIGKLQDRPGLAMGATAFLQMTLFTLIGVVLSYAVAARAGPLWDGRLAMVDRALGFRWPEILAIADQLGALLWLGRVAYHSLTLQMVVCIVVLSATGQADRLRIAVLAAITSGFATIMLSGLVPALGNVFDPHHYRNLWPSVAWMEHDMLIGLRDGSWRTIDLTRLMGIVTFPSYHATLPIILAWAVGETPRWRTVAPFWAALTIGATPLFGGHYAADVLAGAGLAVLALRVAAPLARSSSASAGIGGAGSFPAIGRSDRRTPAVASAGREAQSGADGALV